MLALGIHAGIEYSITNKGPTRPISPPLEMVHQGVNLVTLC